MQSKLSIELILNGKRERHEVRADQTLVQFLREEKRLTGTHIGCDTVSCGACTVLLNGQAVKSCSVLAVQCDGARVDTVEGLCDQELSPLQQAFRECFAVQCGFCTPGFLMTACELMRTVKPKSRQELAVQLAGNYCRCTGYQPILDAIGRVLALPSPSR